MESGRSPKLTRQTMAILSILMENQEPVAGSELAKLTKLASGTLYPILIRLEEAKWVDSTWEENAGEPGAKPRRRLYRITGIGVQAARKEAKAWKPLLERFA